MPWTPGPVPGPRRRRIRVARQPRGPVQQPGLRAALVIGQAAEGPEIRVQAQGHPGPDHPRQAPGRGRPLRQLRAGRGLEPVPDRIRLEDPEAGGAGGLRLGAALRESPRRSVHPQLRRIRQRAPGLSAPLPPGLHGRRSGRITAPSSSSAGRGFPERWTSPPPGAGGGILMPGSLGRSPRAVLHWRTEWKNP